MTLRTYTTLLKRLRKAESENRELKDKLAAWERWATEAEAGRTIVRVN